jgi:cell division protein FtsB
MDRNRLLRIVTYAAIGLVVLLQLQLWFGEGSLMHIRQLEKEIEAQKTQLAALRARNELLEAQVRSLKGDLDTLEGLARSDLGMIQRGETFYLVAPPDDDQASDGAGDAP